MAFKVEGDYFESCNCDVSCNCVFQGLATQDHCDVAIGWHVTKGRHNDTDLAGLNAVMVVRTGKNMLEGGWKVALYIDERSSDAQFTALASVFSGQAGGHLAALGPLVGSVEGVTKAAITFQNDGKKRRLKIPGVLEGDIEEMTGGDGRTAPVLSNLPFGALTQPVRQGKSGNIRYNGHWNAEMSKTNAFIAEFAYEG